MSFAHHRLPGIAAGARLVLGPVVALALIGSALAGGSAFAQRRPAMPAGQTGGACFDPCFRQCQSSGGSGASCSRACYGRCSGISGDIENRH
jgi:hypothetical protein